MIKVYKNITLMDRHIFPLVHIYTNRLIFYEMNLN
jgi:hypothetical protein